MEFPAARLTLTSRSSFLRTTRRSWSAHSIRSVLDSADAVACGAYEIIVVDDASTDGTRRIAASLGVRVVSVNHRQIAATRNAGARAVAGGFWCLWMPIRRFGRECCGRRFMCFRGVYRGRVVH